MKELVRKSSEFNKIEFWGASAVTGFILFFFITEGLSGTITAQVAVHKPDFAAWHVPFNYYRNYFIPELSRYAVLFVTYLVLNFVVVPKILQRQNLLLNIFLLIAGFVAASILTGVVDTYSKEYLFTEYTNKQEAQRRIFSGSFLFTSLMMFVFAFYTGIKYMGVYMLSKSEIIQERYVFINREVIAAVIAWVFGMFVLFLSGQQGGIKLAWTLLIPSGILLYMLAYHWLIPLSAEKKHPIISYTLRSMLVLAIAYFPIALLILIVNNDEEIAFNFSFLNTVFQLFITVPVTWVLYKRKLQNNEEIYVLRKEIGQSKANMDFLRSQINPHFLFNALNTLYGTAIQEHAERTSEGVQKLGDMMRFMLQENMQEKISLTREIDYLNNYISLQKLRTDINPNISIETSINADDSFHQIAPMLLIPFVENAFKHGISFREPSHIKIVLEIKRNELFFDVCNSKHAVLYNDPEKDKSGIGLENVKQRLRLLYPNKHELNITNTAGAFNIHLTIQLV